MPYFTNRDNHSNQLVFDVRGPSHITHPILATQTMPKHRSSTSERHSQTSLFKSESRKAIQPQVHPSVTNLVRRCTPDCNRSLESTPQHPVPIRPTTAMHHNTPKCVRDRNHQATAQALVRDRLRKAEGNAIVLCAHSRSFAHLVCTVYSQRKCTKGSCLPPSCNHRSCGAGSTPHRYLCSHLIPCL